MPKEEYVQMHEKILNGQSKNIAELKARADYKDTLIMELKDDIRDIKRDISELDKTINDYILKSINDDNILKDVINKQNSRITAIESRMDTLYKLLVATPAVIAIIGILATYLKW